MANVRTCAFLLVLLVNYRLVFSEPTFGSAICSLICDDSDDSGDDESDYYDFYDFFGICSMCGTKTSSEETTTTVKPVTMQPVKIMIPPASGLNLTLFSSLEGFMVGMMPWLASANTAAPSSATTTAPAAAAGNSSAANATKA